ncbi:MAG: PQQ-binding-like beta-propeller repeat protein [Planctomycetota bacterium]
MKLSSFVLSLAVPSLLLIFATFSFAQEMTQFRGEGSMAKNLDAFISPDWEFEESKAWESEIEGSGWSQPIIWEDRVYVTTAVAGDGFKPKDFAGGVRMPSSRGGGTKRPDYEVEWKVVCLDVKTGELLWSTSVGKAQPEFGIHPSNSYATESPAVDQDGIYAYFGSYGFVAKLDHDGKLTWKKEVGAYKTNNDFGTGSSLAIDEGRIFLQIFAETSAKILCLNTTKGETVWEKERSGATRTSWSSPVIWKNDKRTELIVSGGEQIDSYDPASGEINWTLTNIKAPTACSVCTDEKQIYFGGSDRMSKGPLFAVAAGTSGEIAPEERNGDFEGCTWSVPRSGPGMSTPVSSGEFVFMTDRSVASCFRTSDGSQVFKDRMPGMSMIVACPYVIGNEVLVVDEQGNFGAAKIGEEFGFRKLGSVKETVWATPAVTEDSIYLRTVSKLYRLKLKP